MKPKFPIHERERDDTEHAEIINEGRKAVRRKQMAKKGKVGLPVSIDVLERSMIKDLSETTRALVKAEPVAAASSIIRCKNRRFTIGEQPLEAPLQVVILATAAGQFYYDTPYDPDEKSSPVCYALAPTEAELMPATEGAAKPPKPQHDGPCVTCPKNQPGTGARGGFSRACSLRRRIAVLLVDDKSEDPQWASLELSVTAIKGWSAYVRNLAGVFNIPYFLAVTSLDFVDDKKGDYWHLGMTFVDRLAKVRPDWVTPEKGVKVGSPGWFDTTPLGRKIKEINETRALMSVPAPQLVDAGGRGKKRVPVGKTKKKGGRRA